jgi:hypothetical protein
VKQDAGDDGYEDWRDIDEQRGGAGVEMLFGPVEHHGVAGEPQHSVTDDDGQCPTARKRSSVPQRNECECAPADEQP